MSGTAGDRLRWARWEADRHAAVLDDALRDWKVLPAPTPEQIEADRGLRLLTDQILFRFTKLQDSLGERLIPATLESLAEPSEQWPMRDRLDRLEKLGYLDVDAWLQWREIRNRLAHEYPDAPGIRHAQLLAAIEAAAALVEAYRAWDARLDAAGRGSSG
ncbi:MAG: hypothetical protein HYZ20_06505 [Burkholderiales bacterium]|nr:hypothetical protein [Burkholderiales bacterium]